MYNLLEYSKTYLKGSFGNYYSNEANSGVGSENNNINCSIKDLKSFDYRISISNNTEKEVEIVVSLKY